ncbi:MAG: hypothetical protein ACYTGS_15675, partial [Planctomycetota bacterium]
MKDADQTGPSAAQAHPPGQCHEASVDPQQGPLADSLRYFEEMVDHCCDYAEAAKAQGKPVIG